MAGDVTSTQDSSTTAAPVQAAVPATPSPPAAEAAAPAAQGSGAAAPASAESASAELKVPEGLAPEAFLLDDIKASAKELGLDGPKAQKLVDLAAKQQQAWLKLLEGKREGQQRAWLDELTKDERFGGAQLEANAQVASRAVRAVESAVPGLRDWLEATGLGNAPLLVKAFCFFGQRLAEDSIAGTAGQPASRKTPATDRDALLRARYPSMFQTKE